jgi:CspA family cold shock protein
MSVAERFTGRVKWFNNKAGYGFITVTDGSKAGSDIFVHHSSIKIDTEQYKYLVQGEYVEFCLSSVSTGDHEFQAGEVSGIKGGKLMCETRNEMRTQRTQHQGHEGQTDGTWTPSGKPRKPRTDAPATTAPTLAKPLRRTDSQGPPPAAGRGTGRGGAGRGGSGRGGSAPGGRGSTRT